MNVIIRQGKKTDLSQVLDLIKELATYEKAPQEVTVSVDELEADSEGEHPLFYFYVAEVEQQVVGTAIYYLKYSTWKGKCVFLEDIIVKESFRGNQIGRKLFEAVIGASRDLKAKRMEWQVLDWNEPALNFYKKFDAHVDASWVNCKLVEEQLMEF